MSKKNIAIIFLTLVIIAGGVLGAVVSKNFKKKANSPAAPLPTEKKISKQINNQVTANSQLAQKATKSEIIFSPTANNRSFNIVNGEKLSVSGISIRATVKLEKDPLAVFKDADPQTKGIQLKKNKALVTSNWLYPINKIVIDKKNKQAVIELAMINISPKPFVLEPQKVLATIELSPQAPPQKITFKFDSAKTQALSKNGERAQLILKDAVYEIK